MTSGVPPVNTTGGDVAGPHLHRDLRARFSRLILDDLLADGPAGGLSLLMSGSRQHWAVAARHAWWWLLHETTGAPARAIAELTTGELHSPSSIQRAVVGQPFVCLPRAAQLLVRAVLKRRDA